MGSQVSQLLYLGFLILVCPSVKQVSSSGIVGQDMEPKVVGAIGDCWTRYKWDYLEVDSVLPEILSSSEASCRVKLFTCTFIYEVISFSLVWDRSLMDFLPSLLLSFLPFFFLPFFLYFVPSNKCGQESRAFIDNLMQVRVTNYTKDIQL